MDGSTSPSGEEAGGTCEAAAAREHQKNAVSAASDLILLLQLLQLLYLILPL